MTTLRQVRRQPSRSDGVSQFLNFAVPEFERSALHVVLVVQNRVERLGIEQMLRSSDVVGSFRSHDDFSGAVKEVVMHESAVLIAALRDIDQAARSMLGGATRQGMKLLVLIDDDLANLRRLAGVRSSGMVSISDLSATSLHIALQRVRGGEMPIPSQVAHFLVSVAGEERDAGTSPARVRITPREQEVLVLLVDGLSNKQIARRLEISVHGAKRHVANVLAKLDCSNRTLAVAKALREGLYEKYLAASGATQ